MDLMLGNIPKEYEESYLNNITMIADLLKKDRIKKEKVGRKVR